MESFKIIKQRMDKELQSINQMYELFKKCKSIGLIYKISSPSTDSVYIGSTTKTIQQRLRQHKADYKRYLNKTKNYVTSYEIVKYDDAIIELLEKLEYENKIELYDREAYYIKLDNKSINRVIPNRTYKKYYEDNKEQIIEKKKQYAINNKQQIKEHQNEKHTCDCGGKYTNANKARHLKSSKHKQYITN
jgi:hypothetical protein